MVCKYCLFNPAYSETHKTLLLKDVTSKCTKLPSQRLSLRCVSSTRFYVQL